ncbi:MAG: sulfotransferase [Acetobacterales bacterium]
MTAPAIFIGGAGRSGTTLLVDLLGVHPRLSPIYETDFVVDIGRILFVDGVASLEAAAAFVEQYMEKWSASLPHRPHNKRSHERYVHGPHHVLFGRDVAMAAARRFAEALRRQAGPEAFRAFIDGLFEAHARLDGKPLWVNKTPANISLLPVLNGLYPDMLFVHCVRDGRAVAASVMTRPWGPKSYDEAGRWWVGQLAQAAEFAAAHPERYVEVRYEDLLATPEETMASLVSRLGEPEDAASLCVAYRDAGGLLDPGRGHAWRETISGADRAAFEAVAGEALARYGYR